MKQTSQIQENQTIQISEKWSNAAKEFEEIDRELIEEFSAYNAETIHLTKDKTSYKWQSEVYVLLERIIQIAEDLQMSTLLNEDFDD